MQPDSRCREIARMGVAAVAVVATRRPVPVVPGVWTAVASRRARHSPHRDSVVVLPAGVSGSAAEAAVHYGGERRWWPRRHRLPAEAADDPWANLGSCRRPGWDHRCSSANQPALTVGFRLWWGRVRLYWMCAQRSPVIFSPMSWTKPCRSVIEPLATQTRTSTMTFLRGRGDTCSSGNQPALAGGNSVGNGGDELGCLGTSAGAADLDVDDDVATSPQPSLTAKPLIHLRLRRYRQYAVS